MKTGRKVWLLICYPAVGFTISCADWWIGRIRDIWLGNRTLHVFQWEKATYNIVMLTFAAIGLLVFLWTFPEKEEDGTATSDTETPGKKEYRKNASVILAYMIVPVLAFVKNITTWDYVIRWKSLLRDAWAWPLVWLAVTAAEILLFSTMGSKLLTLFSAILQVVKSAFSSIGKTVSTAYINIDPQTKLLALIFLLVWGATIGVRIWYIGVQAVFTDVGTLWTGVLVLAFLFVSGLLCGVFPCTLKKLKDEVGRMDGKDILYITGAAILLAVAAFVSNTMTRIATGILAFFVIIGKIILDHIKDWLLRLRPWTDSEDQNDLDENKRIAQITALVALCALLIPVTVLVVLAMQQAGEIFTENANFIETLTQILQFLQLMAEIAGKLLGTMM